MANVGGRPSLYKEEYCEKAYKLCLLGATDKQMADFFEVSEDTLYEWKKVHAGFSEALKKGKDNADAVIAQSLYHRAKGYKHKDVEIKVVSLGGNTGSEIVEVPVVKYYPPDTTACIFWLKNRQKEKWRDKTDHELTGKDGAPIAMQIGWVDE